MDADTDLDCRAASLLLSLACERALEAAELRALARHIDECPMCKNFSAQLEFLGKVGRAYRQGE